MQEYLYKWQQQKPLAALGPQTFQAPSCAVRSRQCACVKVRCGMRVTATRPRSWSMRASSSFFPLALMIQASTSSSSSARASCARSQTSYYIAARAVHDRMACARGTGPSLWIEQNQLGFTKVAMLRLSALSYMSAWRA